MLRAMERTPPATSPRRARLLKGALAAVALVVAFVLLSEPLLLRLWPQSRAETLEREAAAALAAGRLTATDGRGARELYEAALALDPDRPQARAGLRTVGEAALRAGHEAVRARRYGEARRMLELARALQMPRVYVDDLARALRVGEAAGADIDRLLAAAADARRDGHPEQAAEHYRRILDLVPNHPQALEGREDALADLLQQAREATGAGRLHVATALIGLVRLYDGGHVDLPETVAALGTAAERLRVRGDRALAAGRLDDATAAYWAASAVDGEREAAMQGLDRVARAHARRARLEAGELRIDDARRALAEAEAIAPELPEVRDARAHVARVEQLQRRRAVSPERQAEVQRLLAEAEKAERAGDLLTPPGESAFDRLRAARALAPDDARIAAASARLLPAARACFERELAGNRLGRAGHCLDAVQALAGEGAETRMLRSRLAQRWIAVGDERLGAGELASARQALVEARALDPAAPGLAPLAERLRQAGAGP